MKKLISCVLSGAIVLIPIVTAAPVLADAGVSAETSVSDTTNDTTSGSNPTSTTVVDSNGQTVTAGTLPDSPLYWFTNLIEKLQLALTFDTVKKADLVERQALVKLADAQEMANKGKQKEAQEALENYTSKISAAQDFLNLVKDPNSAQGQILLEALNKTQAANISVLTGLLDKLPPQAAQKIALNVVRSMEKAVAKNTPTPTPTPTPTTTPVQEPNDPTQVNTDQDQDQDQDQNKDQDQVKINKDIKNALEKLRHNLEQNETPNLGSSSHPQLERNSNEDHKDVTSPKDSDKRQEGERQQEQEKKRDK